MYEVGPAASVAMHMVESGESAGWQGYAPAVGMAKRKRSHFRQEQILHTLNKGTFLPFMCRIQGKQPAYKHT